MNSSAELSPRRRRRRFLVGCDEGELSVKREPDEDIKDYAETTMNELLGWYGYEKVDSRDTQGLNLTHFASTNAEANGSNNNNSNNAPANGFSPPSSAMEGSDASEDAASHGGMHGSFLRLRSDSVSPGADASAASDEVARQHQQMVSALSSITKHPGAPDSPNLPPGCIVCAWCQKVGIKLFTLKTPNGCKAFCSELCFTQCRRASFKKNKICDWCKHVRHTVNYVDFQDGEQQLQFCSDKCLNQYKMNIFCKETQAHLQMHTHLKEAACKMAAGGNVNLITPDLWLRDCKTNGNSNSPHEAIDIMDDMNSDDNLSAAPSPNLISDSPRPITPMLKEKVEQRVETPQPVKEKEKTSKKSSSKHSPKKASAEHKPHQQPKHHREKRMNGAQHGSENRQSPILASPPSLPRSNQITNGSHSILSPPPIGQVPRPPPSHIGPIPPRHCPPIRSPLSVSSIEHGRQPFLPPNMMPPPFQFFAQQHMEAILRSQHGLDLRSKVPPPLPIPPWVMPPFPPVPPHHHLPPPLTSRSPSQIHSSPPSRNHHQNIPHKSSHHSKHKHSKHSSVHSNSASHSANSVPTTEACSPISPSLLPPVTVMVPFPLVLPIPLPIPVPIPIPPEIMEKYSKNKEQWQKQNKEDSNILKEMYHNEKKRKNYTEPTKHRKKRRLSENDRISSFHREDPSVIHPVVGNSEHFQDRIESVSFKTSENAPINFHDPEQTHKPRKRDIEAESGSFSPLSEEISSNEADEIERTFKNGDKDNFSNINFSNYNLSLLQSSPPVGSQATDPQLSKGLNDNEFRKSPSPTNLSMKDKQRRNLSSNPMNFKKKHLRQQLSLMI